MPSEAQRVAAETDSKRMVASRRKSFRCRPKVILLFSLELAEVPYSRPFSTFQAPSTACQPAGSDPAEKFSETTTLPGSAVAGDEVATATATAAPVTARTATEAAARVRRAPKRDPARRSDGGAGRTVMVGTLRSTSELMINQAWLPSERLVYRTRSGRSGICQLDRPEQAAPSMVHALGRNRSTSR